MTTKHKLSLIMAMVLVPTFILAYGGGGGGGNPSRASSSALRAAKGNPSKNVPLKFSRGDAFTLLEMKEGNLDRRDEEIFYLDKKASGKVNIYFVPESLDEVKGTDVRLRIYFLDDNGRSLQNTGDSNPQSIYYYNIDDYSVDDPIFTYDLDADEDYYVKVENLSNTTLPYELRFEYTQLEAQDSPCTPPEGKQTGKTYSAQWVSQTQGTGRAPDGNRPILLDKGETKTIAVSFKNTGTATWYSTGDEMVAFYVYRDLTYSTPTKYNVQGSPEFGQSLFANNAWGPSFDGTNPRARTAVMDQCMVEPGEVATFYVTLYTPASAQCNADGDLPETVYNDYYYRDDYSMSYGPEWMDNPTNGDPLGVAHVWVPIRVGCDGGAGGGGADIEGQSSSEGFGLGGLFN